MSAELQNLWHINDLYKTYIIIHFKNYRKKLNGMI